MPKASPSFALLERFPKSNFIKVYWISSWNFQVDESENFKFIETEAIDGRLFYKLNFFNLNYLNAGDARKLWGHK